MRSSLHFIQRGFIGLVALAAVPAAGLTGGCAADMGPDDSAAQADEQVGEAQEASQSLRACVPGECRAGLALWQCNSLLDGHLVSAPCKDPRTTPAEYTQHGNTICRQITYVCGCALGQCGTITVNGTLVDCGNYCIEPQTCGGGGVPNQCGAPPN